MNLFSTVTTRSQSSRNIRIEQTEIDAFSDDGSNTSEITLRRKNEEARRSQERDHERHRREQRFMDMNRQIGEVTSMERALTEKISNGRDENGQNVRNIETSLRSDTRHRVARPEHGFKAPHVRTSVLFEAGQQTR